jgi:hypothetical protein
MMEAARTYETSVDNYFTRQYIPEDKSEHHTRRRENLKSHIVKFMFHYKILLACLQSSSLYWIKRQVLRRFCTVLLVLNWEECRTKRSSSIWMCYPNSSHEGHRKSTNILSGYLDSGPRFEPITFHYESALTHIAEFDLLVMFTEIYFAPLKNFLVVPWANQ